MEAIAIPFSVRRPALRAFFEIAFFAWGYWFGWRVVRPWIGGDESAS